MVATQASYPDEYQSPMSTHCFITKFLEDLNLVHIHSSNPAKGMHVISKDVHVSFGGLQANQSDVHAPASTARWQRPAAHEVKLNVDGGLSRDGTRGAAAVICRDKNGLFLCASAVVFQGLVDPATLEASACNEALALALDIHIDSLCVASDCSEVVANIKSGAPCRYVTILREIKAKRSSFRDV